MPVKSVLAVVFIWQRGKLLWQIIAFQHKMRYALRGEEYFIVLQLASRRRKGAHRAVLSFVERGNLC